MGRLLKLLDFSGLKFLSNDMGETVGSEHTGKGEEHVILDSVDAFNVGGKSEHVAAVLKGAANNFGYR